MLSIDGIHLTYSLGPCYWHKSDLPWLKSYKIWYIFLIPVKYYWKIFMKLLTSTFLECFVHAYDDTFTEVLTFHNTGVNHVSTCSSADETVHFPAPGARFKNPNVLLNLRALKISMLYKSHIFQCMGKIFCVEFQRVPLKFHTKYLTHTLKDKSFMKHWNFKSS